MVAPGIEAHAPLNHKYDKGHDWCIHCWKYIAMQVLALCYCELQVLQTFNAGRQYLVPTGSLFMADGCILCRWQHTSAGGVSPQPVVSPSALRSSSETLAVFRKAEQGKQRQARHGSAIPSGIRAHMHLALFPRRFTVFLRLIV